MKKLVLLALLAGCGAQTIHVAPVKVEPIHMTIDVTVHDGEAKPSKKP